MKCTQFRIQPKAHAPERERETESACCLATFLPLFNSFPLQIENVPIKARPNMSNVQHLDLLPLSLMSGTQQSNYAD